MKVKELIKKLKEINQESTVFITLDNNDGCDTCGYGSTSSEEEVVDVIDLGSKIWLETY